MSDDNVFQFLHPDGAPGQLHQALGDAGFKAWLEQQESNNKAQNATMTAHSTMALSLCERNDAVTAAVRGASAVVVLASMPVIVWLWEWALRL